MKRSILIPVISIFAGIVVVLMLLRYPVDSPQGPVDEIGSPDDQHADKSGAAAAAATSKASKPSSGEAAGTVPVQSIRDLELALEAATNERMMAEAALQQSESAVAELERFVDEIEARGEDPADYADEGLEQFIPAFDAYQRAADRLELAEQMELDAQRELDRARRQR